MSRVKASLDHKRIRRLIWLVLTFFVLLGYSLQSVAGSAYYSMLMQPYTTVTSPPVILQNGTAGTSTIYTNSTSAKVSVVAPAPTPTYYPSSYNVLTGTYLSGSVPSSIQTVDTDYFIVKSSGSATFGYETAGVDKQKVIDRITGSWFTSPESGVAQSITAYMSRSAGGGVVKCAIYKKGDNSLVGSTAERNDIGAAGWYTFNFTSPKPNLQNIDYYLVAWAYSPATYLYHDVETDKGAYQALAYGSGVFPDPWSPTPENKKYSIYLTYTPAVKTVSTEFLFSGMTKNTPTQLNFTVVSQYNITSVSVTIQVWNYSSSAYVTSGEGYLNYTSSGFNETKLLSLNTNPQFYTSGGNAKIKATGVLTTNSTYQQETNQIKLVYKYDASSTYDYVLAVTEQDAVNWTINLQVYDSSNIARLSNTTISFRDGTTSDQIIISGGNITQSEGPSYNLTSSATIYIKMSNVDATSSGTSYIYVYLKILVPDTSTYALYTITFEIT